MRYLDSPRKGQISRRQWLGGAAAGTATFTTSHWFRSLALANDQAAPRRSCILLWMAGGPSQLDTFDVKPGHANAGDLKAISTSVPDIQISEHLPRVARCMDRLVVIRSMSTKEGDHGRATDHLRTGYLPQASIQFPVLGSLVSNEHRLSRGELPNYVSIFPRGLFRAGISPSGFLGADHAPLVVGGVDGELTVENASLPEGVSMVQNTGRLELLRGLEADFLSRHPGIGAEAHRSAYARGLKLMSESAREAFAIQSEPDAIRERYGRSQFGQGCLLARRLVERRVPFIEVTLGGWDTHQDNFDGVKNLCAPLDQAWSTLIADLAERGLLDSTCVVWMGEFGRTPAINPQAGRDHYPKAWSVVLGGGGIRGGQVIGRTSADGMSVEERPVTTPDLLATICTAMELDPRTQNISNVARPIRLVDPEGKAVGEALL
ncbi:hypothetical protein Pan44_50180 [Caulifigura coniformis]|uniref:DUF1501 domain-containing protein n=1 Tax=Caulifigura coniformis TaxID=2527983 RepID=A0A517SLF7_9PLAN|nr:DUF1501 domain-containing protein [Caulifigura coniformis]QDT56955.1 hypothetical protein Pan44_50180 [Caulifigura coniformis]